MMSLNSAHLPKLAFGGILEKAQDSNLSKYERGAQRAKV